MRRSFPIFLLVISVLGCGSEPTQPSAEDCDPPEDPQSFEIGTGEHCFARVESGATVPLMAGPQGGFHVWLAVGCTDCGDDVWLRERVFDASGVEMTNLMSESYVDLAGEAWPQQAGIQLIMPGFDGESDRLPVGTALRIQVEALDQGGKVTHTADMNVVLGETETWDDGSSCSNCNG